MNANGCEGWHHIGTKESGDDFDTLCSTFVHLEHLEMGEAHVQKSVPKTKQGSPSVDGQRANKSDEVRVTSYCPPKSDPVAGI